MLKVAVVEDEKAFIDQLETYLKTYGEESGEDITFCPFLSGKEFVEQFQPIYDIILLDIQMPEMDGMTVAQKIRQIDDDVVIVFITNLAQYALKGYEIGALDYILKPLNYSAFKLRFARAIKRNQTRKGSTVVLKLNGGVKLLKTKDIYYVESDKNQLHYHTTEGEFIVREALWQAEENLKKEHFAKCSRWYLVNLLHITEIRKNSVIVGDHELEISRRCHNSFLEQAVSVLGGEV